MSWRNGGIPVYKDGVKPHKTGLRNKRKAHWRKIRQAELAKKLANQRKKDKRIEEFEQRYQGWADER